MGDAVANGPGHLAAGCLAGCSSPPIELPRFDPVLAAMGEPLLWCGTAPDSYRIVWLHSLSGPPGRWSNWPRCGSRSWRST